jgi:hypothetical protein
MVDNLIGILDVLESQDVAMKRVISYLNQVMDRKKQDKRNFAAWHASLNSLLPQLKKTSQIHAKILMQEFVIAEKSNDTDALNQMIQILQKPDEHIISQMKNSWVSLKASQDARALELNAAKSNLQTEISQAKQTITNEQSHLTQLHQALAALQASGC